MDKEDALWIPPAPGQSHEDIYAKIKGVLSTKNTKNQKNEFNEKPLMMNIVFCVRAFRGARLVSFVDKGCSFMQLPYTPSGMTGQILRVRL